MSMPPSTRCREARRHLRCAAMVAALSAAVLVSACRRGADTGFDAREARIREANAAGIFLFGNGAEPSDLDPQTVTGVPEHKVLMALMEGLVSETPGTLDPEPAVAERWEISTDGLTYTFFLRENARWTNGDPITSEDFLRSYQRILTPSLGAEYASMIYDFVAGAKEYHDGTITDFSRVGFRAVDDHTLEIRLKHPTPFLLRAMASHYAWWPVPIRVVEQFDGLTRQGSAWTRPENFVGNGPFRLKAWLPQQKIVVERNPTYWDAARVRLNEIHFFNTENIPAEERMYRTGQLHRAYEIPHSKLEAYRASGSPHLRIEPYLGSYFYRINVTRPPFTDVRVRRAFALAVNREDLVTHVTRGGQQPAYNYTPPGFPGYAPRARLTGTIEEARRLLAEAGYPQGRGLPPVEIHFNTSENHLAIAESLQAMWRQNLGVDVTLKNQEWKVYLDAHDTLDYTLSRSGWVADYLDCHTFLEIFVTNGGNNDTGWANAEYDALRARALQAATDAERFACYQRMEEILMEELPIIPLYFYTRPYLLHPSVKGWIPNPLDNHPFKYIWLENDP